MKEKDVEFMREEFVPFPAGNEKLPFYVELAGVSYCDGGYRITRSKSGCAVAEYVISGTGTVLVDGRAFCAGEGDLYLLPPGKDHFYYSSEKDPWIKIWVNVRGPLVNRLLELYNPQGTVVFAGTDGKNYIEKMHQIGREEGLAREKHEKCALVFHELLQFLGEKTYEGEDGWSEETRRIKEYIDKHVVEHISLKELGEMVFLSESQVIRIFRRDLGVTPYEYILNRKLEHGKLLLRSTSMKVKEIAFYLGFCDEHYFAYLFRKKTGMTPTGYRKDAGK